MKRIRLTLKLALITLVVTIGLVSGCGKSGGKTLAVVGDYEITTDEFNEFVDVSRYAFPTAQGEFDKKRVMLDSMIISRLLIQAAYEKGLDKSEELARVVLANKDRFLLDILAKKEIVDKAEANETEIKDFYNHLEYRIRASHIVVADKDTAQAIFERIESGENFEKLAYEYSIDPSAKKNKGDLGYFSWGALVDEVQDVAFRMEPGEISPPVKSVLGYHIVKLVDKLANEQRKDFKTMKDEIEQQIIARKSWILRRHFFEMIDEKYQITVDTNTCRYLLHKRESMYPPQLLATLPRNDFDTEQLDRDEKELVFAVWDGGQMTLNEYLTEIQKLPSNVKPDLDQYDSLASIIQMIKRSDLLITEAHRRGLDSDPEYIRKVKLFKELNMADLMRNDSIPKPLPPDEGMLQQYYDEHLDEFTTPARIHVYEILLSDELKARELKKKLRILTAFREKARKLTERPGKRNQSGDLGFIQKTAYPEIFDLAMQTPVGSIGGPIATRGKHSIFWVDDKVDPELKDFPGCERDIHKKLTVKATQEAFRAWVEERKKTTSIDVDEDALWSTVDMDMYVAVDTTGTTE